MLQSLAKNVKKPISIDILLVDNNKSGGRRPSVMFMGYIYDFTYYRKTVPDFKRMATETPLLTTSAPKSQNTRNL